MARELENREAELSRRDTFYKEQQGRIQEKNAELYKMTSQQFHEAASKAESTINTPQNGACVLWPTSPDPPLLP
ncbi:MICOS complex subunit Mic25 [Apodemus speciosus]|uniref:MICOS complex subunit Mic25 n=1 Tax=Apodemus speciosus TaxID=105296 RepID=A0ABQ0EW68_APOSI